MDYSNLLRGLATTAAAKAGKKLITDKSVEGEENFDPSNIPNSSALKDSEPSEDVTGAAPIASVKSEDNMIKNPNYDPVSNPGVMKMVPKSLPSASSQALQAPEVDPIDYLVPSVALERIGASAAARMLPKGVLPSVKKAAQGALTTTSERIGQALAPRLDQAKTRFAEVNKLLEATPYDRKLLNEFTRLRDHIDFMGRQSK